MSQHRSLESEFASPSPVLIVGTGRCGSTVFQSLLARHPDLAWPSTWSNLLPHLPAIAAAHRIWNIPGMDAKRDSKGLPKPAEPNPIFERFLTDPRAEDITAMSVSEGERLIVPYFDKVRRYQGGSRVLLKLVGRPVRVSLTASLWPEAHYVDIRRALKPTVSSVLEVDFYDGWGDLENWPWDAVPEAMRTLHEKYQRSHAVGIAIGLWLQRRVIALQLNTLPEKRRSTVEYHDLVNEPLEVLRGVCSFLNLPFDSTFSKRLQGKTVYAGADEKWRRSLSAEDINALTEFEEIFGY